MENTTISAFDIGYPDLALSIAFSIEYRLQVFPDADSDVELPYWEVFTPYGVLLTVGPGRIWSCI